MIIMKTRKHSNRMHTARSTTLSALKVAGPQVNKLEQVCQLGHKMSLAWGSCTERGSLYGEFQFIMDNGHVGPPPPVDQKDRQTPYLPATSLAGGN